MIQEALQYIADLARAAAEPKRLDVKDPRRARFYAGDGKTVEVALPEPPRDHAVKQLADLIAMAGRFNDNNPDGYMPVVFYDESKVILVIDDNSHRCETATLALIESDAFRVVRSLAKGTQAPKFDLKAFIRLLRIDLAGTLAPAALLDVVRRVKFETGQVTTGEVRRNRESLGKEISSAVSAEADIPEAVCLNVPVYKTLGEADPRPIRCTVECDPSELCFRLIPYPDEVERVQQLAMASIAERLADGLPEGVPHYHGSPVR